MFDLTGLMTPDLMSLTLVDLTDLALVDLTTLTVMGGMRQMIEDCSTPNRARVG